MDFAAVTRHLYLCAALLMLVLSQQLVLFYVCISELHIVCGSKFVFCCLCVEFPTLRTKRNISVKNLFCDLAIRKSYIFSKWFLRNKTSVAGHKLSVLCAFWYRLICVLEMMVILIFWSKPSKTDSWIWWSGYIRLISTLFSCRLALIPWNKTCKAWSWIFRPSSQQLLRRRRSNILCISKHRTLLLPNVLLLSICSRPRPLILMNTPLRILIRKALRFLCKKAEITIRSRWLVPVNYNINFICQCCFKFILHVFLIFFFNLC